MNKKEILNCFVDDSYSFFLVSNTISHAQKYKILNDFLDINIQLNKDFFKQFKKEDLYFINYFQKTCHLSQASLIWSWFPGITIINNKIIHNSATLNFYASAQIYFLSKFSIFEEKRKEFLIIEEKNIIDSVVKKIDEQSEITKI